MVRHSTGRSYFVINYSFFESVTDKALDVKGYEKEKFLCLALLKRFFMKFLTASFSFRFIFKLLIFRVKKLDPQATILFGNLF